MFLNIEFPVGYRIVDPSIQNEVGARALSIYPLFHKPRLEMTLTITEQMLRTQFEKVYNEILTARVGSVWMFDGGNFGTITEPMRIGYGDGSRVSFAMPFDYPYAPACVIQVSGVTNTAWTMAEPPGVLIFSTAPAYGSEILLTEGKRRMRVIIADAEGATFTGQVAHPEVYNPEKITVREVEAVSRSL